MSFQWPKYKGSVLIEVFDICLQFARIWSSYNQVEVLPNFFNFSNQKQYMYIINY